MFFYVVTFFGCALPSRFCPNEGLSFWYLGGMSWLSAGFSSHTKLDDTTLDAEAAEDRLALRALHALSALNKFNTQSEALNLTDSSGSRSVWLLGLESENRSACPCRIPFGFGLQCSSRWLAVSRTEHAGLCRDGVWQRAGFCLTAGMPVRLLLVRPLLPKAP